MERILKVYTDTGPLPEFIKSLSFLYLKHGYIFHNVDRDQALKKLIKQEFKADFINDQWPKLVFETENQKTKWLLQFN